MPLKMLLQLQNAFDVTLHLYYRGPISLPGDNYKCTLIATLCNLDSL